MPTKNWTLATEPSVSAAVAVTVVAAPTPRVARLAGAVMVTVGDALAATIRLIAALVAWLPAESSATAVRE